MKEIIPMERIENKIFLIRGQKVMLDRDLAELYGVETKVLNQAVKRNISRFPEEFMFKLTNKEAKILISQYVISRSRSQIVTLKRGQNIKYLPYAFTEQGVAMLSSVLNSERAVQINIMIIKTFIRFRRTMIEHQELIDLLQKLGARIDQHDAVIDEILAAIRELMTPVKTEAIGFRV